MQLSYNLIKEVPKLNTSKKVIETNYIIKETFEGSKDNKYLSEKIIRKNYEALGANILKKAKMEAEELILNSRKLAHEIEKKAYEDGYNQGKRNGFEDGYNDGLIKIKEETEEEIKERLDKAESILKESNKVYRDYLINKENEIVKLAYEMASIIVKKELTSSEGVIPLIENILEEAKGEDNIIIRCNNVHIKYIKEKIEYYKKVYVIKGEIFLIEDELMEPGNALIDKGTGKAIVGLDIALEKLEKELFE